MPHREITAEEILEQAPDAIAIAGEQGRFVYANPACERMLGWSREELSEMTPADLFAPAEQQPPRYDEMRRGQQVRSERMFRRKNGSTFVASLSGRQLSNGMFIAFVRDETEREELSAELHRRTHDLGERIKERRCLLAVMDELHEPEDLQGALARIVHLLPPGWQYPDVTVARIEVDGTEHRTPGWRRTDWTMHEPIRHLGEAVGAVEIAYLEEAEFIPEERELLRAVARRIGEGVDRQRTLEVLVRSQRLEAVGQLAGGIAHDFNNVLTAIASFTLMAMDAAPEGSPIRQDLEEAMQATDRARQLTRQLLAFGRRQVLTPRVVDVGAAIRGLERMLARAMGEHIELRLELDESPAAVRVDPAQLEQVVVNLALNARDAMPDGGRLTIRARGTELTKPAEDLEAGLYVQLEVHDTGRGMDASTAARVFEPFFTTKVQGHGTGLGLATVYGIVRQSGGAISVDSEPDRGTVFRILFPRVQGPERSEASIPPPREAGAERVLVVEDEEVVRRIACRILQRAGYHVLEASDGLAAVDVLESVGCELDLVVTDIVMPGLGGAEVLERFRERCPHLPFLLMSGYSDDPSLRELHDVPFLAKPFTPTTMLDAVRDALDREARGGPTPGGADPLR